MGRIDTMETTPVVNIAQRDDAAWKRYSDWMVHAYRNRTSGVEAAKKVFGRQDFCWNGNYRHYIWDRPFEVDFGNGRVETWHWRLFASKRGLCLEIENRHNEDTLKAGIVGLDHFIKTWEATNGL